MDSDGLGPLERRVMAAVWEHGPQTPREVLDRLNADAARPLAYTTAMTILVRLDQKGYLHRVREGRTFRYAAIVGDADVLDVAGRRDLDRLLARYGPSNVARFAVDLGPDGAEFIERLRALAEDGSEGAA